MVKKKKRKSVNYGQGVAGGPRVTYKTATEKARLRSLGVDPEHGGAITPPPRPLSHGPGLVSTLTGGASSGGVAGMAGRALNQPNPFSPRPPQEYSLPDLTITGQAPPPRVPRMRMDIGGASITARPGAMRGGSAGYDAAKTQMQQGFKQRSVPQNANQSYELYRHGTIKGPPPRVPVTEPGQVRELTPFNEHLGRVATPGGDTSWAGSYGGPEGDVIGYGAGGAGQVHELTGTGRTPPTNPSFHGRENMAPGTYGGYEQGLPGRGPGAPPGQGRSISPAFGHTVLPRQPGHTPSTRQEAEDALLKVGVSREELGKMSEMELGAAWRDQAKKIEIDDAKKAKEKAMGAPPQKPGALPSVSAGWHPRKPGETPTTTRETIDALKKVGMKSEELEGMSDMELGAAWRDKARKTELAESKGAKPGRPPVIGPGVTGDASGFLKPPPTKPKQKQRPLNTKGKVESYRSEIKAAAKAGDVEKVKRLVAEGGAAGKNINAKDAGALKVLAETGELTGTLAAKEAKSEVTRTQATKIIQTFVSGEEGGYLESINEQIREDPKLQGYEGRTRTLQKTYDTIFKRLRGLGMDAKTIRREVEAYLAGEKPSTGATTPWKQIFTEKIKDPRPAAKKAAKVPVRGRSSTPTKPPPKRYTKRQAKVIIRGDSESYWKGDKTWPKELPKTKTARQVMRFLGIATGEQLERIQETPSWNRLTPKAKAFYLKMIDPLVKAKK